MKVIIGLIGIVLTSSIFISPTPKTISGTWVLQKGNYLYYPYILRLKTSEGYLLGTLDIPTQHIYDMPLQSVIVKSDSIFVVMDKQKSLQIKGVIGKKEIHGYLLTGGKQVRVSFVKL